MSDLLHLASALRALSDAEVEASLRRRYHIGAPKDFFDLSQNLLADKSITASLRRLSGSEAAGLKLLMAGGSVSAETQASLLQLGLCVRTDAGIRVLDAVRELAAPLLEKLAVPVELAATSTAEPVVDSAQMGLAAIAVFETQQAICELLLDAEKHPIRLTGKTGFGITDVKRLGSHLGQPNTAIRAYYSLTERLHLLQLIGDRWWLTSGARQFLNDSIAERWRKLAQQWVDSLGPVGAKELSAVLAVSPELSLSGALKRVFPLADSSLGDELENLSQQAQGIGFSVSGSATILLTLGLAGRIDAGSDLLDNHLPRLQHSLIVQADQSLIAPGPLDTATELELRRFADLEQVSVACTYRITAMSICRGLESGLSIAGIRAMLQDLNGKELPQPVEYLLRDTEAKFGKLVIFAGRGGAEKAVLKSSDGVLLTQVLNDSRLRAFALQASNASSLATRFEPETLYHGLRDNGYLAIRVTDDGTVISPVAATGFTGGLANPGESPLRLLIANLRAADLRVGASPDDGDITRQIQLAVKNKAVLDVVASDSTGSEIEFRIVPTALANGRLRGMDSRNDVERTIPLSRILRVRLG